MLAEELRTCSEQTPEGLSPAVRCYSWPTRTLAPRDAPSSRGGNSRAWLAFAQMKNQCARSPSVDRYFATTAENSIPRRVDAYSNTALMRKAAS